MAMSSKPLQSAQNPIAEAATAVDMSTRSQGFDASSFELGGGDNAGKNLAWNISSFDGTTKAGPLMDVKIWPVLSKPTLKSSNSDSLRTVADVSVSAAQVTGSTSLSHNPNSTPNHVPYNHQEQVTGLASLSHNPNSTPNHVPRQKSMRGRGGDLPGHPSSKGIGGFGSIPNTGNEHQHQSQHQSHSFRRDNGGSHPRGNAFHYHGGKRGDYDRRNHDWNFNSNFTDKDTNFQGPPFHVWGQFILRNIPPAGPFSYHDMPASVYSAPLYSGPGPYPELYRPFRPVQAMAPVIHPYLDPELNARILQQIEYYFSNDNLASTTHLRENMDAQGWVSIKLIAGFKKVMQLTNNIQLILDVLRVSVVVEVEEQKVRRRNDWEKWLLPPSFSGSSLTIAQ